MERPDLSHLDPTILAYIESLEAELGELRAAHTESAPVVEPSLEPSEPPGPFNVITVSATGQIKRTPRHLYQRQRRGGMGLFDLEVTDGDPPAHLVIADEAQPLLVITQRAKAFRLLTNDLPTAPIRARGEALANYLPIAADERPTVVTATRERGYLVLVTERGYVRIIPAHLVGEKLTPGFTLYNADDFGMPVGACWTAGDHDLFIATRQGQAIRFSEKAMSLPGGLGLRLETGDAAIAIVAVRPDSGVFLLGADGKGTIRLMAGFNANKAPGAGGKLALKTDQLIGAVAVKENDDVFIISRLSKLIRFKANEIPPKEGVVQGVNCMALRADETVSVASSQ